MKTRQFTLKMSEKEYSDLRTLARIEQRPMANMIKWLVSQELNKKIEENNHAA